MKLKVVGKISGVDGRLALHSIFGSQAIECGVGIREQLEALLAPLPHLSNSVLDNTFLNGLNLEIRAEVIC